ncbi:hypothetical protein [Xanthomonas sp. LMG 12459]|uniref:hypothetical protein n=1 Tax=Xanthomonas sp. LMG 12459 TaxID=1591131 RepID=UPI001263B0A9|nr:hypothetical protein [Xanthomonas sp. LMG 12459]
MATSLKSANRKYSDQYNQMLAWAKVGAVGRRIGMPMSAREVIKDGLADYWRLWESLASWVNPGLDSCHSVKGCITDSSVVNAWPFRDALGPGQHIVVVTKATILRMQRIAHLVMSTIRCTPTFWEKGHSIGNILPQQELGPEDFSAFSEMVMQAAFVYLFAHEFAHLHNGHEGCAAHTEDSLTWWSEKVDQNLGSRAVEFDADASALAWTVLFFSRFNANASILSQLGAVRARMVSSCLKDESGRVTVAALGSIVFNLSMSSGSHGGNSTHPNFRERVRLARIAVKYHAANTSISGDVALDCSVFGAMMVFIDAQHTGGDRILVGDSDPGVDPPFFSVLRDALLAGDAPEEDVEERKRHRSMARKMSALMPSLNGKRIRSSLPRVDWWSMELNCS